MAKNLILRNEGSSSVVVDDLGVFVPATSSLNINQLVNADRFAVYASQDLRDRITNGLLIINDGTSDIALANVEAFLERFCVLNHSIETDHFGDLPESRIADGNILARIDDDEIITGNWEFVNGVKIQTGTALPSTVLAAGSIFYKTSVPTGLYISDGDDWISIADASDFDPSTGHTHDGTDSPKVDHGDLDNVTANQHHDRDHALDGPTHTGTLSESKIARPALPILARTAEDETITGTYDFSGGAIILETGTALPTGTISSGRLFWKDTGVAATRALYVGDGVSWVEFSKASDFSAHDHDGTDSPQVNHNNLLNKGTNTHAEIDAHLADTIDPHGSVMTVSGHINTPEVRGTGGDMIIDATDSSESIIYLKNSGAGGLVVRVVGTLEVDGTVNSYGTTDLLVEDNKIVLNSNYTGSTPSTDASFEVERGSAANAIIKWDEALDTWLAGVGTSLYKLAFSDRAETITGAWGFSSSLTIPHSDTLPSAAPAGGLYWNTDTDEFFVGDGTDWKKILSDGEFALHTHDGTNSPTIDHGDLDNVTENQHHNKLHALSDATHHDATLEANKLPEAWIQDNNILARVAGNENIVGNWSFAAGSLVIPTGSAFPTATTEGGLFWRADTDTLYAADGAAWQAIAKKGGILSVSPGLALNNTGTTQSPILNVGVDNSTIVVDGAVAGVGGSLKVGTIAESQIADGSILARVGSNETITGNWEFNGTLTIPTITGVTPPVSYPNGQIVQLEGNDNVYIGTGDGVVQIATVETLGTNLKFCHTFTTRANHVPAGTFLKFGDVVSSFSLGALMISDCKLAGIAVMVANSGGISDGSTLEVVISGSTPNQLFPFAAAATTIVRSDLNVSLTAGQILSVRCGTNNGTALRNPIVTLYFK